MSFLFALALALAALVAAPLIAHFLKRGEAKEQEFPPARLVPKVRHSAQERSRLQDRGLLALRAAMIVCLAFLGAVPYVSCDRLALGRTQGASVALALVIDDSMSMGTAAGDGQNRFAIALRAARELLDTTREGDAVAVVLAGKPARLLLSPTTELERAKSALETLELSDRATDMQAAVRLAESALARLPHVDKRVVGLSDFAGATLGSAGKLWAPLSVLRERAENCGIIAARRRPGGASVRVSCTSELAARQRRVLLRKADGTQLKSEGGAPAAIPLRHQAGPQEVLLEQKLTDEPVDAQLSGRDSNPRDDLVPLAVERASVVVAVVADPETAGTREGRPSVLEQGLKALDAGLVVQPLPLVPDDQKGFEAFGTLIVDDPPGLGPESRAALGEWLKRGGLAVGFLGPRVEAAPLGATFAPFASGAPSWQESTAIGIDPVSVSWLGEAAGTLEHVSARGRVRLQGAVPDGAVVEGKWKDGAPWLLRQALAGGGAIWTVGLPVSIEISEFSFQPAFLALLDRVARRAKRGRNANVNLVGEPWRVDDRATKVEGPTGEVALVHDNATPQGRLSLTPERVGRYLFRLGKQTSERVATPHPSEIIAQPRAPEGVQSEQERASVTPKIDASRQFVWLLLLLLAAELGVRLWTHRRHSRVLAG